MRQCRGLRRNQYNGERYRVKDTSTRDGVTERGNEELEGGDILRDRSAVIPYVSDHCDVYKEPPECLPKAVEGFRESVGVRKRKIYLMI